MTGDEKKRLLARQRITCARCGVFAVITRFNAEQPFTALGSVLVAVECHGFCSRKERATFQRKLEQGFLATKFQQWFLPGD